MNKKISPNAPAIAKSSPLSRIVARGQQKVGFKKDKGRLLMQFSERDHRRIAQLIAKWLEDPENQR